jgi:hypothetical protein
MSTPRVLACLFAFAALLPAQSPTAYTVKQAIPNTDGGTMTISRSGAKAVIEYNTPAKPDGTPAQHSLSYYDINTGISYSWDPATTPVACNGSQFSGDWGDPFKNTQDFAPSIAKGDIKQTGVETVHGIPAKIYQGATQGLTVKVWFDEKDQLVLCVDLGATGTPPTTMVNILSVSIAPPPSSLFTLPAACAGYKPPPTPAEVMAAETGDNSANFVNAIYGPGSANSCTIALHVVSSKTMAPFTAKWQAAIDTTYDQNAPTPPHYEFGVGNDGTATFSGAGLHEVTSQIRNNTLQIPNPPAYFNLSTNFIQPGRGAGMGLIYRQCFAPTTNLYYVLKDPKDPAAGGDFLYAKSGKYAAAPTH